MQVNRHYTVVAFAEGPIKEVLQTCCIRIRVDKFNFKL